jgi:hypothetical protein
MRDLRSFRNQQAGAGALSVIGRRDVAGHISFRSPIPGEGSHDQAVGQGQVTQREGLEQRIGINTHLKTSHETVELVKAQVDTR